MLNNLFKKIGAFFLGRAKAFVASFKSFFALDFFRFKLIVVALLISIAMPIFMAIYMKIKLPAGDINLTSHYTALGGIDMIADRAGFYNILGFAMVILVINFGASLWLFNRNKLLAKALMVFTPVALTMIAIALLALIRVNLI